MKNPEELKKISAEFAECQDVLEAIGDATRQTIMMALIEVGCNEGMRVGEITEKTHLSRPAVSYHLRVLKEADIVTVNKVGTMNFYSINPENTSLKLLQNLMNHMDAYIQAYYEKPKEEVF